MLQINYLKKSFGRRVSHIIFSNSHAIFHQLSERKNTNKIGILLPNQ
jgi:hypothetical protein